MSAIGFSQITAHVEQKGDEYRIVINIPASLPKEFHNSEMRMLLTAASQAQVDAHKEMIKHPKLFLDYGNVPLK